MRYVTAFTALCLLGFLLASGQGIGGKGGVGGEGGFGGGVGGGKTWTLIQNNEGYNNVQTYTPTSPLGSGHLVVLFASTTANSNLYLTSAGNAACTANTTPAACCTGSGTGSCGVWTVAGSVSDASFGSISMAYTLNSTAISVIPMGLAAGYYDNYLYEYSATASPAFDVCGTVPKTTASTSILGVSLSLATSSEVIVQGTVGNTSPGPSGAPTSPNYGNFLAHSGLFTGTADLENTSNGSAPTWPWASSSQSVGDACAFK